MLQPSPAPRLVVHLLGEFRVEHNGQPLTGLAGDRPQSLLAYLLLHRHAPQSRRHLSFLLWPDSSEAQARSNLRNLFFTLRQALPEADAWLLSDTATIQWRPDAPLDFDVAEFRDRLAAARRHAAAREHDACAGALEAAIAAYGGDLLPGNYDDWLLSLREDLRAEFAEALRQLAALHESRGDYAAALRPAGRYLQTDPLNEGAYIQLMRLHALLGDRAAVQRLYQTCTALLRRELDVEPSPATQAAYQELLRLEPVHTPPPPAAPVATPVGTVGTAPAAAPPLTAVTPAATAAPAAPLPASAPALPGETLWRPRPLPTPATPFLGRERELAEIAERLADPHCRLLTLLGPGGIGKTRLALQAGLGHQPVFADGVAYVSLAGMETAAGSLPGSLPQILAVALNAPFRDSEDAYAQLLAVLQPLELLLVIDNFEHAVSEAPFLSDLLAGAPQCKLLVTSRHQLDLVEEWVYDVGGLPLPQGGGDPADDENSAVQLFVRSARRASHAFTLDAGNRAAVAQICRTVGGLPLAIELAASWVRLLPPAEIAAEIARGLDFLAGRERNLPERHRSLRAVFDYSWNLLPTDERRALAALSVLQGGFDREAAAAVAGANLPLLLALAARSLVQRVDVGRYGLHELVRQYAHEQLRASADWEPVRDRHLAHFAEMTAAARDALYGPDQRRWLERLELEHDNLRAALEWAFRLSDARAAGALLPAITEADTDGRGPQWRVETALRAVADIPRFWNGRGYLREGEGWLQRGLALSDGCDPRVRADALGVQGWLINMLGDTPRAQELQRQSLALFRACGDERGMAEALDTLGDSAWFQGAYDEARQYYRECLALRRRLGNPSAVGLALYSLGRLEVDAGSLDDALPLLEEALLLLRRIDDRRGVALTLNGLGRAALRRGLPLQAEPLVREALAAFAELGNRVDIPECLEELAFIADAVDQPLAAARLLGAAAAMRLLTGAVATVDARDVADLTQRLSADPQHAAAYHDGSRFSLEQAVAYALSLAHSNNVGT